MTYHNYIFFCIDKPYYDLSSQKKLKLKNEFFITVEKNPDIAYSSYTLLGFKGQIVFMLWLQADSPSTLQEQVNSLMQTSLGRYLCIRHTLFGAVRSSQYSVDKNDQRETKRHGGMYLIIYPFTKTQTWYNLSFAKRRLLMKGHIQIGHKYPQITQLLLYSIGIDDSEFIVSYETDDLLDFQTLVMDLRSDKVRNYTLKDTPIFTCIFRPLKETLNFI